MRYKEIKKNTARITAEKKKNPKHGLRPPWAKGFCPNPKGRPKGVSFKTMLLAALDYNDGEERILQTRAALKRARKSDQSFRTLRDTTDGPPKSQNGEGPSAPVIIINNTLPGLDASQRKR